MADRNLELKLRITADGKIALDRLGDVVDKTEQLGDKSEAAGVRAAGGYSKAAQGVRSISDQLASLQTIGLGFLAFNELGDAVRNLSQTADAMKNLEARVRLAAGSQEAFEEASTGVFDIAQRTQQPLEAIGTLYTRLAQPLRDLGKTTEETLGITESIAQAFRISGAGASEAQAAIIQLSQGLASGALRGDEFNSVIEQGPRLAQALADGLGVTRGELRGLAEDGALTAEAVTNALQSQAGKLAEEFSKLPETIGGAVTRLENNFQQLVGQLDETSGASGLAVSGVNLLASNLDLLATAASAAGVGGVVVLVNALKAKTAALIASVQAAKAEKIATQEGAAASAFAARNAVEETEAQVAAAAAKFRAASASQALAQAGVLAAEAEQRAALAARDIAIATIPAIASQKELALALGSAAAAEARLERATLNLTAAKEAQKLSGIGLTNQITSQTIALNANTVATERAEAAQRNLDGATRALGPQAVKLTEVFTNLNSVLDLAFAGFVGFQIGSYLRDEFETVRKAGVLLASGLTTAFQTLGFQFEAFKALFTGDTIEEAFDRYQKKVRETQEIFRDQYALIGTEIEKSGAAAEKAGNKIKEQAPKVDGVAAAIQRATGEAVKLGEAGGKAGDGLDKLSSDQLVRGIGSLSGELLQARDNVEAFEKQFNEISDADLPAFETANREAFANARQRVLDLGAGVQQLRNEQFKRLGVDTQAVLTGIDAKARDLLDTFKSVASDPEARPELLKASYNELLKRLDSPAELTELQRILKQDVRLAGLVGAEGIAEIGKKLDEAKRKGDETATALEEAFKRLGVVSTAELRKQAVQAEADYKLISRSGQEAAGVVAAAFEKSAEAQLKLAQAQGSAAVATVFQSLRAAAATDEQRTAVDKLGEQYGALERKAGQSNQTVQDGHAGNVALIDDEIARIGLLASGYEDLRRKRIAATSLANDPDRADNLSDVSASTARFDGRAATAFGVAGVREFQAIVESIKRAIDEGEELLSRIRSFRVQRDGDVGPASKLINEANRAAARLKDARGPDGEQAQALAKALRDAAIQLDRELGDYLAKADSESDSSASLGGLGGAAGSRPAPRPAPAPTPTPGAGSGAGTSPQIPSGTAGDSRLSFALQGLVDALNRLTGSEGRLVRVQFIGPNGTQLDAFANDRGLGEFLDELERARGVSL